MIRTREELELLEESYERLFRGKKDLLNKQVSDLKGGKELELNGCELMTLLLWIDKDRCWGLFGIRGKEKTYKIKYINGEYVVERIIKNYSAVEQAAMAVNSLILDLETKIKQGIKAKYYYVTLKEKYEWKKENNIITDKELKRLEEIKEILNT